jgi:hypothetical protein
MLRPTYILREKKKQKKIKEKPTPHGRPAAWARFFEKILPHHELHKSKLSTSGGDFFKNRA